MIRLGVPGVAAALLALALGACTTAPPANLPMQQVGDERIGLVTRPDPPRAGDNAIVVVVRRADGAPVRDARVDLIVSMEAMGTMPRMEYHGHTRARAAGIYETHIALPMGGDWDVAVRVAPASGAAVVSSWRIGTMRRGATFVGAPLGQEPGPAAAAANEPRADSAGTPLGAVTIESARRQALGIRVEPVTEHDLAASIRAAGRVAYDETRLADVSLKYSGWVRSIDADFVGRPVRRGDVLFRVYSPDLWSSQQELLEAMRAAGEDSAHGGSGADLARAAFRRLELWGLASSDLAAITRAGQPLETVPVRAPVGGVITEKNVVLGSPVQAGQILYRIARIDPVWVLAAVDEQDLPLVRRGMPARVALPGAMSRRAGRVTFIAPELAQETRTGTVRLELPNADTALKPGMYVDVELSVPLGRTLAVPESAVLPTGARHVVFVDAGSGRLVPRDVALGRRAGGYYQVLSGLRAGDRVVTSGNFLVASESSLRSAERTW